MKVLILIFSSLLILSCSFEGQTWSDKKYTKKYFEKISETYPNVTFEIKEPLVLAAIFNDDGEATLHLENSYHEYKQNPAEFDEIIKDYIVSTGDLFLTNKGINPKKIIPIIKPKDYFDQFPKLAETTENFKIPNLIWEKYNEDLIIVYAEDRENNTSYFVEEGFQKLNISKDTLLNFAVKNLRNAIPFIERIGGDGNFGLTAGGAYEASLILLSDIWTRENFDVEGDIVVAIPTRDLMFITGSEESVIIDEIRNSIDEAYDTGNHSISKNFYRWNKNKFERM